MNKALAATRLAAALTFAVALEALGGCAPRRPGTDIQPAEIETTLLFIGDAGEPDPRRPSIALDSLKAQAARAPERTIIVFLGDNVYPNGIPRDSSVEYMDARRRLLAQVNSVPAGARGIFIPGNHDWAQSEAYGRDIRMLPGNGCPGPFTVDTGRLRLVLLDTQWWLHDFIVKDERSNCRTDMGAITSALREQVSTPGEGRVVIAAGHHPLMTGGEHGGYCGITGPFRRLGGASQDILSGSNRTMRDSIESAFTA